MPGFELTLNPVLRDTRRIGALINPDDATRTWEWLTLFGCGASAAALTLLIDLDLRIPGHSILKIIFPMALGLALVPRRKAGTIMGGSALLTAILLHVGMGPRLGLSAGAVTSLLATGPLLDWSLRRASRGWRLYAAFAMGGLGSNLLAFLVRGAFKMTGLEGIGKRPLFSWLAEAGVTYPVCGIIAGLVCAALWFSMRQEPGDSPPETVK